MNSIFDIHKKLGLNVENGLFIRKNTSASPNTNLFDLYKGNFSNYKSNYKVEYTLKKLQPHSFFLFNSEPLLIFFDYSEQINREKRKKLSKDVWNFNKSALVFVNTPKELTIYNGFKYNRSGLLEVLDTIKDVTEHPKLEQYSYWKIVTTELWNAKDEKFKKQTRVDKKLLDNIKTARKLLIDEEYAKYPLNEKHANRIIGRLIFIRYLIDRNVIFDYQGRGKELLTKDNLPKLILQKDNLFDFFEYLLKTFNGKILPLNGERNAIHQNHLIILSDLLAGNEIKARQPSFFNIFDFDFIPVELISNIYETFLSETQDADKAFYTPSFLVDYVLSQTVKPFIEKQKDPEKISCKIVDLTCGSGIFLCETLRSIINRYIELTNPDRSSIEFKKKIKQLLAENIYGNDTNQEAIEIAKFSLFITLLDYFENPKDIAGFEFPDISNNFYNYDVFDTNLYKEEKDSNIKLDDIFGENKKIEPDFILGNPPWGKLYKKSRYLEYCKERAKKETKEKKEHWLKENKDLKNFEPVEIKISNKEFAQAFLLRLSDFSTHKTVCQVIVTSKLLYNLQADTFRNYFLNNFLINEVLEISSVRHQIFSNAVGPAAIIKYKYAFESETKENVIDYISLKPNPYFAIFKTILIEKCDYKEIIQNELIENDWLWKVLVYGHILDYRFIKRLKDTNKYPITLGSLIEDKENKNKPLFASVGIKVNKKNKVSDASHLIGLNYIQTKTNKNKRKSDLQRYYINFSNQSIWNKKTAAEVREDRLFKIPPALLIKIGFTTDFKLVASITNISSVFTNSIYAIKSKNQDSQMLENLLGLVSSDLMIFYMIMCGSSIGVEREQLINKELFPFPIVIDESISLLAKKLITIKRLIEIHKKSSFPNQTKIYDNQLLFNEKEMELNQTIISLYHLTETEKDLIDYTKKITIPILQAKKKKNSEIKTNNKLYKPYKKVSESEITDYINIVKKHFSKFHNGGEKGYINARIVQSKNILAIEFYIDEQQNEDQWNNEFDNEKALEILASVGFQKVSNELFIQKDIKVLKSKSFSVLKINQYKHWHKAVARLDVIEFMEAMIQSQILSSNDEI